MAAAAAPGTAAASAMVIAVAETGQHLPFQVADLAPVPPHQGEPVRGQADDQPPPVNQVAATLDEPAGLQVATMSAMLWVVTNEFRAS